MKIHPAPNYQQFSSVAAPAFAVMFAIVGLFQAEIAAAAPASAPASALAVPSADSSTSGQSSTDVDDPIAALEQGNRRFQNGDFEGAITAYRRGFDPRQPHATLTYNLATAFHHAGQLPEAILWYRRGASNDPWLEENLWLARKSLGSQSLPLTGTNGWLALHGSKLAYGLIAWIWLAGLAAVLLPSSRLRAALIAATLGSIAYLALTFAQSRIPEAVVLLEDCATLSGELPAGTEAWASLSDHGWRIAGVDEGLCPIGSITLVNP